MADGLGPLALPDTFQDAFGNHSTCRAQAYFRQLGYTMAAVFCLSLSFYLWLSSALSTASSKSLPSSLSAFVKRHKQKIFLLLLLSSTALALTGLFFYRPSLYACDVPSPYHNKSPTSWLPFALLTLLPMAVVLMGGTVLTIAVLYRVYRLNKSNQGKNNHSRRKRQAAIAKQLDCAERPAVPDNTHGDQDTAMANNNNNGERVDIDESHHVKEIETKSLAYDFDLDCGDDEDPADDVIRRKGWQSVLYLSSYVVTYAAIVASYYTPHSLLLVVSVLAPLQGLWIGLVYMIGRIYNLTHGPVRRRQQRRQGNGDAEAPADLFSDSTETFGIDPLQWSLKSVA